MPNYWKQQGVPHRGWQLQSVIDVREHGEEEWEADYETCMMCGNEKIRFVHVLSHDEIDEDFRVGCVCAEKMTSDYINPARREKELRNKANRRISWTRREWKNNAKGNFYLKHEGHFLLIFKDKRTNKYKVKIDERFGEKTFDYLRQAKIAAFEGVEFYKKRGIW